MPLHDHEIERALDIARALARAGVPIFTARPAPGTKAGFHLPDKWERTVADPGAVDAWRTGDALCAIGGHVCDFLDIDPRNGGAESSDALRAAGVWPAAYGAALTPSGGRHELIQPLGVGKGELVAGVDLQGGRPDGSGRGFVFIAPTVRASKVDGVARSYRWSVEPDLALLAHCRGEQSGLELAKLLPVSRNKLKLLEGGPPADDYYDAWCTEDQARQAVATIATAITTRITERGWGGFRDALNKAAYSLGGYVGSGWMTEDQAMRVVTDAIGAAGYPISGESWETAGVGLRDGASAPIDVVATRREPPLAGDAPEFWSARPVLAHLHQFALARRVSPWALLGAVLVRVVAATPPRVQLPPLIGGNASLNMFLALVGRSGDGKGAASTAAKVALDLDGASFAEHTVGSGQGIAHAYAHREKEGLVRHAESAVLVVEEVDHMAGHAAQNGSTMLAELKRLYCGEKLGHLYVDPTRRMEIEEHSYRAGLIVGVQPEHAGVLFDDSSGGTPQRFLWLPTAHPHPDVRPPEPAPWRWEAPVWPGDDPGAGTAVETEDNPFSGPAPDVASPFDPNPGTAVRIMAVPECVALAVDAAHLARSRGEGDPLDGHRLLCQEKVAAAFAILDGRCDVDERDWGLASELLAASDRTRSEVLTALSAARERVNTARGAAEAVRAVTVDSAKEAAAVRRCVGAVRRALAREEGWVSGAALRKPLTPTSRGVLAEALELMLQTGDIISEVINYQGQNGTRYRLSED